MTSSVQLSHQISLRPIAAARVNFRTTKLKTLTLLRHNKSSNKLVTKLSSVKQQSPSTESTSSVVDVDKLVGFLYEDLPHLFDDQGIDPTAYDESVKFRDPITKHDSIAGYLFNISLLKNVFRPEFFLHWVKQV